MILDKLHLDKESRQERRAKRNVWAQADWVAEEIAYGERSNDSMYYFNIGQTPNNMSVIEYATEVGKLASGKAMQEYTSMDLARFDLESTATINALKAGIGLEGLETMPPPQNRDVTLILKPTQTAVIHKFAKESNV